MLEHVPAWLGQMLRNLRAGHAKLAILDARLAVGDRLLDLGSPAFADGGRLPERFTADGDGVSPPLVWGQVPDGTACLALIVEDPDAPSPSPLVHAIVTGIPADARHLAEGAIARDGPGGSDGSDVGRSSFRHEGWLPPDPPTGHGGHDYVFQLFALSAIPALATSPGRSALVEAMAGKVLAAGLLVGTYSRGEPADIGTTAGLAPA